MHKWVRPLGTSLYLLLFLLLSRHALAPVRDFVLDDWHHLQTVQERDLGDLVLWGLRDVYRPVYNALFWSVFKILGDHPVLHSLYGIVMQFVLVLVVYLFAREFSGRRRPGALAALIFCCLPIINEPFHFHTTSIVLHAPILYLLSFISFERFLRQHSRVGWLVLSALAYGVALFSYEYGVFLLPLYLVLWRFWATPGKRPSLLILVPMFSAACIYLVWRFTNGFGFGIYTIVDSSYFAGHWFSIGSMLSNLRVIVSWWAGLRFWRTIADGIYGFQSILPKYQFLLLVVNAVVACGFLRLPFDRSVRCDAYLGKVMLLMGTIAVCGYLPFLLSPAASRHNLFPGIAICVIMGLWCDSVRSPFGKSAFVALIVLFMACSQGLATYWKNTGQLSRMTFDAIEESKDCWSDGRTILVDTFLLRHRLTHGLGPASGSITHHGPCYLMPSWVYVSMLKLHAKDGAVPFVIHDREHGARWEGETLIWHARFDPSSQRASPREAILVLDALTLDFRPCKDGPR